MNSKLIVGDRLDVKASEFLGTPAAKGTLVKHFCAKYPEKVKGTGSRNNMALKIKWKVADAPTGRYRSFQNRAWPSASVNDKQVAYVVCKYTGDQGAIFADYTARLAKNCSSGWGTAELIVKIADYNGDPLNPNASFGWKQLKVRFQNMDDVKAAVLAFYTKNPTWLPKENPVDPS